LTSFAPNDFTHLHVHSEFSLLDGLGRITEMVDAAAQHGMDSLAITDHGALMWQERNGRSAPGGASGR
jgi:DNA polymerase III alpha subunit